MLLKYEFIVDNQWQYKFKGDKYDKNIISDRY